MREQAALKGNGRDTVNKNDSYLKVPNAQDSWSHSSPTQAEAGGANASKRRTNCANTAEFNAGVCALSCNHRLECDEGFGTTKMEMSDLDVGLMLELRNS